ncbi:MAG TPA: ABC transporter permease [Ktedonobacteraceae bacterium]|nr:ABC transporter permease [Ktedonobacteraceae bacterium]
MWYIAKKDLLLTLKDRSSILLLLVVPLVLIAVVGFAFGNAFGTGSSQISIQVAVSNQDNGYVGKAILSALKINTSQLVISVKQYDNASAVTEQVANSNVNAGIVIPAGTSDALTRDAQNGAPIQNLVKFYALPSNNDARITITQQIVSSVMSQLAAGSAAIGQVYHVCNQPGNHCAQSTIDAATIASSVGQSSGIAAAQSVESLTAGEAPKIGQFDLILPGYAIFFALFSVNAAAATILQEKEDGTFRRLLIAPIQKYALLGGKLLAQFLLTLLQLAILFAVGYFAFHIHIGNWPAVIALLIGASFAATGLGILLVSLVKTRRQLAPVVTLVTLLTSAIGGAWWPLFIEPTWMQQIAKIGLTAWAMEGLNAVMIFGKGFEGALPDILGLLGYGLVCFLIAMRFFRFQEKTA